MCSFPAHGSEIGVSLSLGSQNSPQSRLSGYSCSVFPFLVQKSGLIYHQGYKTAHEISTGASMRGVSVRARRSTIDWVGGSCDIGDSNRWWPADNTSLSFISWCDNVSSIHCTRVVIVVDVVVVFPLCKLCKKHDRLQRDKRVDLKEGRRVTCTSQYL